MMNIREMPAHITVEKRGYGLNMSVMGDSGGCAFNRTPCKEEMFHSVGKAVGWGYSEQAQARIMGPHVNENIDMDNPTIFFWLNTKLSKEHKRGRASRILRVLTMLAGSQGCKAPIVMVDFEKVELRSNNLVAIEVDKFYFSNPVALSGLLTFMRAAGKTTFVFNGINNFVSKMVSDKNKLALGDKTHLIKAKRNKVLGKFLDRSLPYFELKPQDAFRRGKGSSVCYYGIAEHLNMAHTVELSLEEIGNW